MNVRFPAREIESCSSGDGHTDLGFRLPTAFFCSAGIEWDITEANQDELVAVQTWTAAYKWNRDLLHSGITVDPESAYRVAPVDLGAPVEYFRAVQPWLIGGWGDTSGPAAFRDRNSLATAASAASTGLASGSGGAVPRLADRR